MRALVLSDTHLHEATLGKLPPEVWSMAEAADVVLHAGDVVSAALLDALGERAPIHAVLGNNDHGLARRLPEAAELDLGGVAVAVVHDAGARAGRAARLARRFPRARVVVFGHSHDPVVDESGHGQLLLNPGSPTQRRRQPVHTVAWLETGPGGAVRAELVPVGPLAS